jgi:hypothetical protein
MYFCLVIAFASTLLWINILHAEYITAQINPYATGDKEEDKIRAKMKNVLVLIMALFWSAVILYL